MKKINYGFSGKANKIKGSYAKVSDRIEIKNTVEYKKEYTK